MSQKILRPGFDEDPLARVADELLGGLPGAAAGDLSDALVLLPSARACRDLEHTLLERSGRDALLLPRLLTDTQWAGERAVALGCAAADLPDDRVRGVLLAHRLQGAAWLEGGDAAAAGLADAFLVFFDEVRRHGLTGRLLESSDTEPLVQLARPADAETVAADVARIREVWSAYRAVVPVDAVDRLVATVAALARGEGLPATRPQLVVAAGFGRVDPLRAALLRAGLDHGAEALLVAPAATAPLDRLLLATWGDEESGSDPLAATRQLLALLGAADEPGPDRAPPLGERLRVLSAESAALGKAGPELLEAEQPEDEARAVTDRIVAWLRDHGAPPQGLTVATNDPQLAARITAHLRDAGLDADNTVGEPLAGLPAGLLLRFILRAALTGLRAEPLLEVLGHPYTRLSHDEAATGTWALRLERMFRRETGPQTGLAGLQRRARDRDAAALELFRRQGPGMEAFVAKVTAAFSPLLALADARRHRWPDLLDALAEVWAAVAPERPLGEHRDQPDLTALARLLAVVRADGERLPEVTLSGFAADLGRLLGGESVVPHRPRSIPITVTGLVEARLARSDLLVLAGLNDGVFPAAAATPVVLPGRVRRLLALPTWREARARDAELFMRLLHGAPQVVLTWSRRRDGQPVLASPLVERLQLALGGRPPAPAEPVSWRREELPLAEIAAAQAAFAAEPAAVPGHVETRPFRELSWSALQVWRDCPYRSLLERGFGLRADEDVRDEFGRRDYGRVVHAILSENLQPGATAWSALVAGDGHAATEALVAAGRRHFMPGAADLPERSLWADAFARLVPALVAVELPRFRQWRPLLTEAPFLLPLPLLRDWLADRDPGVPALAGHAVEVVLRGAIDRVDRAEDGTGALAVIDYKTGSPPTATAIDNHEDLQLAVYALAVATGVVEGCGAGVVEGFFYGLDADRFGPSLKKGQPPLLASPLAPGDFLLDSGRALLELAVQASDPAADHPLLPRFAAGEATGTLPCRWCEHRGVCRIEERTPTPTVAVQLDAIVNGREVGR